MGLKQIKNKIISTQKTGKVTKAMEAVSAVKMRKSQERALAGKSYAEAALRILRRVSRSREAGAFMERGNDRSGKVCLVIITSDKGLAGNLNSAVLKNALQSLLPFDKNAVEVLAFGRKSVEFFKHRSFNIVGEYINVRDDIALHDMRAIVANVTNGFVLGSYAKVFVAYQNFVSTFEQRPVMRQVLPLDVNVLEEMVRDIVPQTGLYSEESPTLDAVTYTVEPDGNEIMETIIPQLVEVMLYHAMLENKASEHSARMVAMKNATDKTKELTKALTLEFNKARQAVITAEVSEITGGIEAMKQ